MKMLMKRGFALMSLCALFAACGDDTMETTQVLDDTAVADTAGGQDAVADTASGPDAGPIDDSTVPATPSPLSLNIAGTTIDNGGVHNVGIGGSVALFSKNEDNLTLINRSNAPLTVVSMTITPHAGVMREELTLRDFSDLTRPVLTVDSEHPVTLEAGARFDFLVRVYPVHSGRRSGTLTVVFGDGEVFEVEVAGEGHEDPSARFTPEFEVTQQTLFAAVNHIGGANSEEFATGFRVDSDGASIFSGNTVGPQGFHDVVYVGKVAADGSPLWVKMLQGQEDLPGDSDALQVKIADGQFGGSVDSLHIDDAGDVYVIGGIYVGSSAFSRAFVTKLAGTDGATLWTTAWHASGLAPNESMKAKHSALAFAGALSGDVLHVTGGTGANVTTERGTTLLLSIDTTTGEVVSQLAIDQIEGLVDEGYTIAATDDGSVFIGGKAGSTASMVRVDNILTAPSIGFTKTYPWGFGGRFMSLDTDGQRLYGTARGNGAANEFFAFAMETDGTLAWAKAYGDEPNQQNLASVARVVDGTVYVGGQIGLYGFDGSQGDGMLVAMDAADGALQWASHYYSGKGPQTIGTHRVTGIERVGDTLRLAGQAYTGNMNGQRYSGYWYVGTGDLYDVPDSEDWAADLDPPSTLLTVATGEVVDPDTILTIFDAPNTPPLTEDDPLSWEFTPMDDKNDGHSPDADQFLMTLQLN